MIRRRILPIGLIVLAACAERDGSSADVASTEVARWTVAAEPQVEIGVLEGPAAYQFSWANAAFRQSDGGIVVAEGSEREIRFFDAQGRHVHTVGADGEGPGEYRNIDGAWRFGGDSILVHDARLGRVSVLAPTGEFVRSFLLDAVPGMDPEVLAVFGVDGGIVARPFIEGDILQMPQGVRRDTLPVSIVDRTGRLERQIGRFPATEYFGTGPYMGHRAFGARALFAAGEDVLYLASSDSFRIEVYGRDGARLHEFTQSFERRPITAETRRQWVDDEVANATGDTRELRIRFAREMTFPDHKEALERLVVDRAGNVWVLALDAVNDPAGWRVFDRDGQQIATVDTHAGFEPRDIGDDWVLGVVRDDTGVPRVQLRSLQRNVEE